MKNRHRISRQALIVPLLRAGHPPQLSEVEFENKLSLTAVNVTGKRMIDYAPA